MHYHHYITELSAGIPYLFWSVLFQRDEFSPEQVWKKGNKCKQQMTICLQRQEQSIIVKWVLGASTL